MRVLFCSCVIITNESKVLITQRPTGKFMEGFWEFPGGKVKNFEQFNAAAVREINEELGVQIEIKNLQFLMNIFYQYPNYFLSMQVYFANKWQGKVKGMEKQRIKWVDKAMLNDCNMLPASREIIQKILKSKKF